jgi:hypothetical protein
VIYRRDTCKESTVCETLPLIPLFPLAQGIAIDELLPTGTTNDRSLMRASA